MPALSLTVTPGYTFADDVLQTADDFNAAAAPTVELEENTVGPEHLKLDELVAEVGDSLRADNYCPWGTFHQELFFSSAPVSCEHNRRTPIHPGWYVIPDGIAINAEPSIRSHTSESNISGRCGLKVSGNASLTSVSAGTYLPPGITQMLYSGNMTFSVYIWNNTNDTFTPSLEIYTSTTAGDEESLNGAIVVSASASCANNAWTRVEFDFDASLVADFAKGAHFRVKVTKSGTVLEVTGDYFIVADAQIDKGTLTATLLKRQPIPPDPLPAGTLLPFGGAYNAVPPGYLYCDGTGVSRGKYARLFKVCGTSYGAGDTTTTFNLPDLRGRLMVGAERVSASEQRSEVAVNVTGASGDLLTVASGATAPLRLGMGVYGNASVDPTSTIVGLTDTTIQLSVATAGNFVSAVYFSKLGVGNAQTLGASGAGITGKARRYKFSIAGCSVTNASDRVVPPGTDVDDKHAAIAEVVTGMKVSDGAGYTATVAGFSYTIAAGADRCQVVLSSNYTGSTNANATLTFELEAPEGDLATALRLAQDEVTLYDVTWGNGDLYMEVGINVPAARVRPGMVVTHVSGGGSGFPAGTVVVVDAGDANPGQIFVGSAFTAAAASAQVVKFSRKVTERATTAPVTPTPGYQTVNYIIKT